MGASLWGRFDKIWRWWSGHGLAAALEHRFGPVAVIEKPPQRGLKSLLRLMAGVPHKLIKD